MKFDLIIIGAGPGGYVAAIRAAQLDMTVAIVDRRDAPGGVCLNVGCIPSKALLHSSEKYWSANNEFDRYGITFDLLDVDLRRMMAHKEAVVNELTSGIDFLFRKNKIQFFKGVATLQRYNDVFKSDTIPSHERDNASHHHENAQNRRHDDLADRAVVHVMENNGDEKILEGHHIIIATGSEPIHVPGLPFDGEKIVSSTEALNFIEAPHHIVIVGGGYIGLELGSVWRRLGSQVTIVESMPDIIMNADADIRDGLRKSLMRIGIEFKFNRRVFGYREKGGKVHLQLSVINEDSEREEMISCNKVLVAVGRKPHTDGLNLQGLGIETDDRGFIKVDSHYRTNYPNVYAIGDVIGGVMLAHKAEEEGVALVESISGQAGHVNYKVIPSIIYTQPEVASVGLTEEQALKSGYRIRVGKFPLGGNGLSRATGETEGFVKMIADADTDRVLGAHILGAHAGSMIPEVAIAMEFSATSEDIARTCHAHPSLSEAVKEAAWGTFSKALHK